MAGTAALGSNLVDGLVETIDDLRSSLHAEFGVRQWRVYTVLRTWSGGHAGEGDSSDVETELTPSPLVEMSAELKIDGCGLDEDGTAELSEISLTYTEAELRGPVLEPGDEWLIKLVDAHGQLMATRYYVVSKPPIPDRIQGIGWVMELKLVEGA